MNPLSRLGRVMRRVWSQGRRLLDLSEQLDEAKVLSAKLLIYEMRRNGPFGSIQEAEFKAFSQFGDDGIIQYLIHSLDISAEHQIFIELGVETYKESNTRFLLMNNNWRGLILDGDHRNIAKVRDSRIYWRHELTAVAAFIDRDNINSLIRAQSFAGEIGLLSIDIDGNDYWVWERIEVVSPIIVVVEYNSIFGGRHAVTIPYDPAFRRTAAHYSNLYWGCSLKGLCRLAERKGYAFVGCNSAGNNAYFVRRDRLGALRVLRPEDGYVLSRVRESRDPSGRLTYLSGEARLYEIGNMQMYDIESDRIVRIRDLFNF